MTPMNTSSFRSAWFRLWAALGLGASLAGAALLALPGFVQGRTDAVPRAVAPRAALGAEELAHIALFRKA